MAEFLILPKREQEVRLGKPIAVSMSSPDRTEAMEATEEWQRSDEVVSAMELELRKASRGIGAEFDFDASSLVEDGYGTIQADDDALEELRSVFKGAHVLVDGAIEFLLPFNLSTFPAPTSLPQDWHLTETQVDKLRSGNSPLHGDGVTIAVLDTGINRIEGLKQKVDSHHIYDFEVGKGEIVSIAKDKVDHRYWHGTAVAELIAGDTLGVAPKANLIDVAMIPSRIGSKRQFIQSLQFAKSLPAVSIINFSAGIQLGLDDQAAIEDELLKLMDSAMLPIIAIGNDGKDNAETPGRLRSSFSIGASDASGSIWKHSGSINFPDLTDPYSKPDLVAPGAGVYSIIQSGEYALYSGSSFATAIVSGMAALFLEQLPGLKPAELKQLMINSTEPISSDRIRQGAGLLKFPLGPGATS